MILKIVFLNDQSYLVMSLWLDYPNSLEGLTLSGHVLPVLAKTCPFATYLSLQNTLKLHRTDLIYKYVIDHEYVIRNNWFSFLFML